MTKQSDSDNDTQSGNQPDLMNQHDVPADQMEDLQRTLDQSDEQEDVTSRA